MKRLLLPLLMFLAAPLMPSATPAPLNIEETDGSPTVWPYKLKVTDGSLTDNGDGTATLSTGGGGGSGPSGQINAGNTYDTPYYSVAGSSNVLSATTNLRQFASSATFAVPITVPTITFSTSIAVLKSTEAVGLWSMPNTVSLYLGYNAGGTSPTTTGGSNTCVGAYCMYYPPTGIANVGFGFSSVHGNSSGNTGSNNTGFGYATLTANGTGGQNTAVGSLALNANTGSGNTAVGSGALQLNVSGGSNTAVGYGALAGATASDGNTAVGYQAMRNLTFGSVNTALGGSALNQLTTGSENVSVGELSAPRMTTGSKNTAIGFGALNFNVTGYYSTAVGASALGNSVGARNTAVGEVSGLALITGTGNTMIGFESGQSTTTTGTYPYPSVNANVLGSSNTYLGNRTGQSVSSNTVINKSIAIGFEALVETSNQAQIGGRSGTGNEVNLRVSSVTVEGLTSGQCVQTGTGGLLTVTGSACGSGGGGSSSLQVTESGVEVTSPTASINFYSGDFDLHVMGSTATVHLSPTTTNYVWNTSALQTSSVFYVSSGTVFGPLSIASADGGIKFTPQSGATAPHIGPAFGSTVLSLGGTPASPDAAYLTLGHPSVSGPGFAIGASGTGYAVVLGSATTSTGVGAIGLGAGLLFGNYQGFYGNLSASQDDMWLLPSGDSAGYWKSDGSHNLSISSIDISADTNLAATQPVVLTGDTLSLTPISLSTGVVGTLDISANTNLTAGDHITLTNDDLDIDDDFVLNTGDVMTGQLTVTSSVTITGVGGLTISQGVGASTGAFSGDVTVQDEVYGAGWNGSVEVPTKNALYDKIETISAGGAASTLAVTTGTSAGFDSVASSPTAVVNFDNTIFSVALTGSATAFVDIIAAGITATELGVDSVSSSELNATGVESELEAVLDLDALQGQITDAQIADGAVDGGAGGEITDASVTADDLGADSVGASELASTAIQSGDIEAGDLPSDGYASTYVNVTGDTMSGQLTVTSSATVTGAGGVSVTFGVNAATGVFTTSLTIPNGTGPTVDAVGETAFDTTAGQLITFDGIDAQVVGTSTRAFGVTISSGTGWNSLSIPIPVPASEAITITKVYAASLPEGTTVLYQLNERALTTINTAGTDVFNMAYSSAMARGITETAISNNSIAADAWLVFRTPAAASSGTPESIALKIFYRKTRQ